MSDGGEAGKDEVEAALPVIESAIEDWKAVRLESLRGSMEKCAYEIADHQEASLLARKNLAEKTREFKRTPAGERGPMIPGLLKQYQSEIDRLTGRAKSSEAAFLSLFRPLHGALDPLVPLTQAKAACETHAALRAEHARDGAELRALRGDLEGVTDQSVTVRRLERVVAEAQREMQELRRTEEQRIAEAVEKASNALRAELEEEHIQVVTRLEHQVSDLETALHSTNEDLSRERRRADAVRDAMDRGQEKLESRLRESEEEVRRLRQHDRDVRGELAALRERWSSAASEAESLRARIADLTAVDGALSHATSATGGLEIERENGADSASPSPLTSSAATGAVLTSPHGHAETAGASARVSESTRQLEQQVRALSRDLSAISAARDAIAQTLEETRRSHVAEVADLEREVSALGESLRAAEQRMGGMIDAEVHAEALAELRALRALGYNIIDDDHNQQQGNADATLGGNGGNGSGQQPQQQQQQNGSGDTSSNNNNNNNNGPKASSIEALLTGKCRKLESELTRTRVALEESERSLAEQRSRGEALAGRAAEQAQLIASLEEQVMAASKERAAMRRNASGLDSNTNSNTPSTNTNTNKIESGGGAAVAATGERVPFPSPGPVGDGSAALEEIMGASSTPGDTLGSPGRLVAATSNEGTTGGDAGEHGKITTSAESDFPGGDGGDRGMLRIVSQQRDRFRERISALEDEKRAVEEQCTSLNDTIKVLRADNLSLYEKIRYLESYHADGSSGGSSNSNGGYGGRSRPRVVTSSTEEKYQELYEESVNPFTEFSRNERLRQYKNLNPAERITLTGSKLLLSTKWARMGLFFYSVILHCLVFFTLFHSQQDSHALGLCNTPAVPGAPISTAINPFVGAGRHPRPVHVPQQSVKKKKSGAGSSESAESDDEAGSSATANENPGSGGEQAAAVRSKRKSQTSTDASSG